MTNRFNTVVYIGRFQPLHDGHLEQIKFALTQCDTLIIALGSANVPPSPRNPWSASERQDMIAHSLPLDVAHRVKFVRLWDMPGDNDGWADQVRRLVIERTPENGKIGILGLKKDETSYYLDLFPEWELICAPHKTINGTDIRHLYFVTFPDQDVGVVLGFCLPAGVLNFLRDFQKTERYKLMCRDIYC